MTFSLQNSKKICPRALAESFQNHRFFNIPVKWAFVGTIRAYGDLVQQRLRACQGGTIPCKKYHAGHMRAAAARACRNLSKHIVSGKVSSSSLSSSLPLSVSSSSLSLSPSSSSSGCRRRRRRRRRCCRPRLRRRLRRRRPLCRRRCCPSRCRRRL